MAILTYKEAALKLKVSLDRLMRYIERPEFAQFRCEASTIVNKKTYGGVKISYFKTCSGILFTEKFINLFNTIVKKRR